MDEYSSATIDFSRGSLGVEAFSLNRWSLPVDPLQGFLRVFATLGMSEESVETCLKDQALFDKLSADENFAHKVLKVNATPTFFINAERIKGAISFEEFDKRIKQLLMK